MKFVLIDGTNLQAGRPSDDEIFKEIDVGDYVRVVASLDPDQEYTQQYDFDADDNIVPFAVRVTHKEPPFTIVGKTAAEVDQETLDKLGMEKEQKHTLSTKQCFSIMGAPMPSLIDMLEALRSSGAVIMDVPDGH